MKEKHRLKKSQRNMALVLQVLKDFWKKSKAKLTPTKQWLKCGIDMKALFTDEQLKAGTKFKGNVNGAIMEILKIENPQSASPVAIIKDCKTGYRFQYGLEALKRCNISIIEQ